MYLEPKLVKYQNYMKGQCPHQEKILQLPTA